MAEVYVVADRDIDASPLIAYNCIADYERHHPHFLPPAFSDFRVEAGGVGAGTVVSFRIAVGGRSRAYRMQVAEPSPGRVLTESDLESSLVTTFTVSARDAGCNVRIDTRWQGAGGIGGFFERTFAPRALKKLYDDELERLEQYVRQRGQT